MQSLKSICRIVHCLYSAYSAYICTPHFADAESRAWQPGSLRRATGPRTLPECPCQHLESCTSTPGTRQCKVVRAGTCQYILFWIQGGTRKGKIVHTSLSTDKSVLTYDISMAVHTGMYWYVLYARGGLCQLAYCI